jgi:hypothetical protein
MLSLNLPQMLVFRPTPSRERGRRIIEGGLPSPKGRPQIGGDLAKIANPAQRHGGQKPSIFERNHR